MWGLICNYICDKFFYKPLAGQKRKNEEWVEFTPKKQMKFESPTETFSGKSYNYFTDMKKNRNFHQEREDDEECCIVNEVFPKMWGSSHMMARQSIHQNKYNYNINEPLDKRKVEISKNDSVKQTKYPPVNVPMREVDAVKNVSKIGILMSSKGTRNKKNFHTYGTLNMKKQNTEKTKPTFQNSIRKSLNLVEESYRLSEKVQYMQLLQQHTTKLNSLLSSFTIKKIGCQNEKRTSIPVIDLTKEKNNVVINRSRESIPWTSSWLKSNGDLASLESSTENRDVTKVNTLQDMLKTHSVTESNVIDEILARHATATAEKRRQAEMEAAKLKLLTAINRKAYTDALEEKMRHYMRITTPALEEIEPDKEKYVLPKLNQEQESKVSSILIASPAGEILVEKFGLQIKRRDLQTLKGLNWLNDEVINFYMNLIVERGKEEKFPSVYAFNTFFYPKLISSGHASLKRWTKKVDIFSYDMILVPIHLGMHWCMSVIDFRNKEVRYYDSMGSPNNRCLQALLSYLEAESLDKKKTIFSTNSWKQINVEDIPQQMNGSDCGVFSCVFAEHLARDSPLLFSQDHMPFFRKKMALEIVEANLLPWRN